MELMFPRHGAVSGDQVISSTDDGPYAVRTVLGQTVNGPLRGENDAMEANKLTEITTNYISVAKLEGLWQLFKQDFPDAGQDEDEERILTRCQVL